MPPTVMAVIAPFVRTVVLIVGILVVLKVLIGIGPLSSSAASSLSPASTTTAPAHAGTHFLAANGATFWFGESFRLKERLFAGVKDKAGFAILANQHFVAGL
jgi:hypothetical protein